VALFTFLPSSFRKQIFIYLFIYLFLIFIFFLKTGNKSLPKEKFPSFVTFFFLNNKINPSGGLWTLSSFHHLFIIFSPIFQLYKKAGYKREGKMCEEENMPRKHAKEQQNA
jgi:hypothetical protein